MLGRIVMGLLVMALFPESVWAQTPGDTEEAEAEVAPEESPPPDNETDDDVSGSISEGAAQAKEKLKRANDALSANLAQTKQALADSLNKLEKAKQELAGHHPNDETDIPTRIEVCRPSWVVPYDPTAPTKITKAQARALRKGDANWEDVTPKGPIESDALVPGPGRCDLLGTQPALASRATIYSEDVLLIRVFEDNARIPMSALESLEISSSVVGEPESRILQDARAAAASGGLYFTTFKVGLELLGAKPGDRVELVVKVKTKDGTEIATTRYLDLKTRPIGYGVRKSAVTSRYRRSPVGLWFPIGLVGAHFGDINETGLGFSAAPIGIAVGSKFHFRGTFVGVSLMLGYTLFTAEKNIENEDIEVEGADDNGDPTTTTVPVPDSTSSTFSLTGLTPGILFDIGDTFTVGLGYTLDVRHFDKDLRDSWDHPGPAIFLGLPIGLNRAPN